MSSARILLSHRLALGAGLCVLLLGLPASADRSLTLLEMRAQLGTQQGTTLSSEIPGRILRIPLHDGERFRKGDLLIEFDCNLQQAQLAKANAQLRAAENTLQGNQRLAELNAVGMVELRNSEAETLKAQADIAYLRVTMERCRVVAPYDGQVIHYGVRAYQTVQAGQELIEIIDSSPLSLEFLMPSQWLSWLGPGHRFEVHIEDTGKSYPVRLLRTAARVDPISQTVRAVALMDGDFPELLPGMSGTVQMHALESHESS